LIFVEARSELQGAKVLLTLEHDIEILPPSLDKRHSAATLSSDSEFQLPIHHLEYLRRVYGSNTCPDRLNRPLNSPE
jgi:hypothetical protein